ncbi:Neopullulanase 2 [Frankliniella fusca]|uniref:Neopullulanase 2 n=1 Tax=Frankliniella fusca TaxID=407009 RepID=A0AAE1LCR8_9NEOP|nr:Neopullulanase 2 [Frankliniella fusca]
MNMSLLCSACGGGREQLSIALTQISMGKMKYTERKRRGPGDTAAAAERERKIYTCSGNEAEGRLL